MVDAYFKIALINVVFGAALLSLVTLSFLSKRTQYSGQILTVIITVYFILCVDKYVDSRREFDATKGAVVLRVTAEDGFDMKSSNGHLYAARKGGLFGTGLLYLFSSDSKPQVGECVEVEINYFMEGINESYINFGKITQVGCHSLMSDKQVGDIGTQSMKRVWDYRNK